MIQFFSPSPKALLEAVCNQVQGTAAKQTEQTTTPCGKTGGPRARGLTPGSPIVTRRFSSTVVIFRAVIARNRPRFSEATTE